MKKTILKVIVLSILSTVSCQSQTKQSMSNESNNSSNGSLNKIENYLSNLEQDGFFGTVLFAKNGKVQLKKAYGFSDKDNQIKNEPTTIFDIGSVTKQFTAAAILKLEMQGKLSVEDKITAYFDKVPSDKSEITIHQLLTHSSGLMSGIGDDYEVITSNEFVNRAFNMKLLFQSGENYEYSNVGYSLLGMIIEKVSGMSYENYLYAHLWKPANMNQTGYSRPNYLKENVAVGYNKKNGKALGRPNEQKWDGDEPYWNLKANGGILSSIEDLYKWHLALKEDNILSKDVKKKYFTPYVKEGEDANSYYSYGWAMYKTSRGTSLAAHNGGNGIFFADFWRYLDDDMVIIVLNNNSTPYSQIIASQIGALHFLPDFDPNYPNKGTIQSELDESKAENLVKLVIDVLNENDEEKWKSFIEENGSDNFIKMAPMELHLKYFSKFHKKLKGGKISRLEIDLDEIIIGVTTSQGIENVVINAIQSPNGGLKFDGMMIE